MQHFTSRQPFKHVYHTLDHENIALSTSNITTLFFTLPRYAILFRVTTAPTTAKTQHTAEASIRSCSTTQQSTCIFGDVLYFVFDSNCVVLLGQRVQDCDDGAAMWRGCGYDSFPWQEKLNFAPVFFRLIVGGVLWNDILLCNLCVVFVVDHFRNAAGERTMQRVPLCDKIFFAGLTLISIGLVGFWMNILFPVWEFVLRVGAEVCRNLFFVFACEVGHDCRFPSVSKSEPFAPIWSRCSLQYFFYIF